MANEGVNKAILKWEVDKRSVNDVIKSIDTVLNRGEKLQDGLFDAWQTGRRSADDAKKSFRSATTDIEGNAKAVKQLRDEYIAAGKASKEAAQSAKGGFTLGSADSLFTRGGRALSGLGAGGVGNALQGIGDFFQLLDTGGQAVQMASGGFAALAASAAPFVAIAVAAAPAVIALTKGIEAFDAQTKLVTDNLGSRTRTLDKLIDIIGGTSDDALKKIQDNQKEISDLQKKADYQKGFIDSTFADLVKNFGDLEARVRFSRDGEAQKAVKELEELNKQIKDLELLSNDAFVQLKFGATETADAIAKQTEETERLKKAALEKAQTDKMLFDLMRQQQAKETAEIEAANKKKAEAAQKQQDDSINILKRRDDAIADLEHRAADQRIELQRRTTERIDQIIQQGIDANEAAYQKLVDGQAKLIENAARDEESEQRKADFDALSQQIDANRNEQKALIDHQRRVRDINRSFLSETRDALLDRNFLELFRLQENKKEQLAEEEEANAEAKAERDQAAREQQQDTARQRAFERNERRIALQYALNDARNGYLRELQLQQQATAKAIQLANQGYQAELTQLNNKVAAEIAFKQQAAITELGIINQTEEQKHQIFLRYLYEYQRLLGMPFTPYQNPNVEGTVGGSRGNTQGGRSNFFAEGGFARAGVPFFANEPWSSGAEKFGGVKLPGGMGVTFPFKSGYVDPGKSGGFTLQQNITVQGTNNPELTAQAVVRISRQEAWKVQKEVAG